MTAEQESSTANQFSFHNPKSRASDGRRSFNSADYAAWAEHMKAKQAFFGRTNDHRIGAWTRRASFGNRRFKKQDDGEEIKWLAGREEDDEDSGTPSPPLWNCSPRHAQNIHKQAAGVTARAQEIARCRQEMLETVRGMAEADYELSLRDMVESPPPRTEKNEKERLGEERELLRDVNEKDEGGMNKKRVKGGILRSKSMESGGLLLKMFSFPISLSERKRRGGEKVPPSSRITAEQKGGIGEEGGERQRSDLGGVGSSSTSSNSSNSSTSSSNSNCSSSNSSRCKNSSSRVKRMTSCYSFFGINTDREMEI
ncbi:hypothetical protein Cni_G10254 [Canna indica]|uniref:Uncharacterized protein n=1 Tax=Canna indica TaxID=4628 RepID=A0AAQ3K409_9LILI|nr:hypothetical protein Cni_G10254 [Canna indica]